MKKIQTTKKELLKIENMITVMKKVTGNVEYKFEKIPQKIEQKKDRKKENRREIRRKVEPSQEIQHLNNREEEERSNK